MQSTTIEKENTAALRGELIRGKENIEKLNHDWDKLFEKANDAAPFLSRAWTQTFINEEHYSGIPGLIVVWNKKELAALLPLSIQKIYGIHIGKPIGIEQPSYLGFLINPEFPNAASVAAETWIREKVGQVFLDKHVFSQDMATQKFVEELKKRGFNFKYGYERVSHGIELGCTFDEYFEKYKSSKSRQTIRRKERKLLSENDVKLEYYEGKEITEEILDRISHIQNESWMKRRGAAILGQPFYKKLLNNMAQAGLACIWLMTIDKEDAAFVYALKSHGKLNYHWPAFKLKYESGLSIGQILLMQIIRDACEQNIKYFDFEHGEGEYKRFWANHTNKVLWVVAGRGLAGNIIILYYRLAWFLAGQKRLWSLYQRIKAAGK